MVRYTRDLPPEAAASVNDPGSACNVVRITCTYLEGEASLLKRLRGDLLRATGNPISVSAVARAALATLAEKSVADVASLVDRLEMVKPGPKPKSR